MKLKGLRNFCSPNFLDEMISPVRLNIRVYEY